MNAVVITFDSLPAGLLGCCGNLWVRTPHFDRLAAESTLFHQHHAAWTGEPLIGAPWWTADAAEVLRRGPNVDRMRADDAAALDSLHRAGVRTLWRGECRDRRSLPADRPFESRAVFLGEEQFDSPPEEAPWAQVVADAVRLLPRLSRTVRSPWLLWLQSAGIPVPWTAPREWALRHVDVELDPDDDTDAAAALRCLSDPAQSSSWTAEQWKLARKLCSGAVEQLDASLGKLLDAVQRLDTSTDTLLILMGGRGLPLTPRPDVPAALRPLLSEVAQTPLFLRLPRQDHGARRHDLTQSTDIWPTLREWFGQPPAGNRPGAVSLLPAARGEPLSERPEIRIAASKGIGAMRQATQYTLAAWGQADDGREHPCRLHRKPDDLWETLDLASTLPEEAEEAAARLQALQCGSS